MTRWRAQDAADPYPMCWVAMEDPMRLAMRSVADDGTAEILATVHWKGFYGNSSAWFSIDQLDKFAHALMAYPVPTDDPPILRGGLLSNTRLAHNPTHLRGHAAIGVARAWFANVSIVS